MAWPSTFATIGSLSPRPSPHGEGEWGSTLVTFAAKFAISIFRFLFPTFPSRLSFTPRSSAYGSINFTVFPMSAVTSVGSNSYCLRPCSMRAKSSTFSIIEESRRHSCVMKRKYSCCFAGSEIFPRSSPSAINRTEAMGARNSCDTLETKFDFISASRSCL